MRPSSTVLPRVTVERVTRLPLGPAVMVPVLGLMLIAEAYMPGGWMVSATVPTAALITPRCGSVS